jgi:hypothetical protein
MLNEGQSIDTTYDPCQNLVRPYGELQEISDKQYLSERFHNSGINWILQYKITGAIKKKVKNRHQAFSRETVSFS